MKTSVCLIVLMAVIMFVTGCAVSTICNPQVTVAQAQLSQANFKIVESGIKGSAEMTMLGIRLFDGSPFGIVLSGDKTLTTVAMDKLRAKAGLKGKSRALINVTQDMEYDPWFIIWHRARKTITADVVEFK